jgi:hypothetical protein
MKKISIFLFIVVLLIAMIPIIGNTLVKDTLEAKLQKLESQGIKVIKSDEDVSYFETSRHYEFLVEDSGKFIHYLQKYSDEQLPPYTNALVGGTKVGVDLKYSNIPLSKAVSLDIYPLALPSEVMKDLESKDSAFSQYIEKFLFKKGLLYHIDYEIVSKEFSGYIKDVEENYKLQNNSNVVVILSGTTFKGRGDLIAPSSLQVVSKKIDIKFLNAQEEMSVFLENFNSSSTFENQTTYLSSSSLASLRINLKKIAQEKESIDISKIYINMSSNTQNDKAEINTKLSFETMQTKFEHTDIHASGFNYDFAVSQMDKEAFEKLRVLVSKVKTSNADRLNRDIKNRIIDLLSKGIQVNIIDLSTKNILINGEDIKGFRISSEIDLKEDRNLATKMMISPLLALGSMDFDFKSKISKKILKAVLASSPMLAFLNTYTKTKEDEVEFDISYREGNLKINGKTILGK